MRKFAILFALMTFVPLSLFAAIPAKTELGLIGEFVQTTGSDDPWTMNFDLLFPVNKSGTALLGIGAGLANDDDLNRMGAEFEWNLVSQKGGPFIGASAFGFQKAVEGLDRYTVIGKAGLKLSLGKGAGLKAYAFQIVDGRGKVESDLGVAVGIIAKF